jgi:cytoskeleton protein RodZ
MLNRRPRPPAAPLQSEEALRRIGQELRDARLACGENLDDIAAYLRIRPIHLAALERGDLSAIPGRAYAVGFLRSYGQHLGLDADDLVLRLKAAAGEATPTPEPIRREPADEGRRPTAAVLAIASLLLGTALYGGYHLSQGEPRTVPEPAAPGADELAGPAGNEPEAGADRGIPSMAPDAAPPAPGMAAGPAPVPATVPPAPPAAAPAPAQTDIASHIPPAPGRAPFVGVDVTSAVAAESGPDEGAASAPIAALDSGAAVPAAVPGAQEGRVAIVARETSWIQVRSAGRDFVRSRTLAPGERFVLPDRDDLALWTGNAGGLDILLDGQSVGPIGPRGAVVRNLPLAPESLKRHSQAAP